MTQLVSEEKGWASFQAPWVSFVAQWTIDRKWDNSSERDRKEKARRTSERSPTGPFILYVLVSLDSKLTLFLFIRTVYLSHIGRGSLTIFSYVMLKKSKRGIFWKNSQLLLMADKIFELLFWYNILNKTRLESSQKAKLALVQLSI